ncbi:HXXEE domain-containing protein [Paenibacillus glucanolyticus]
MAAIIFPDAIWLGLVTMYFGFSQILMHGIVMNRKLKSFYNPGLAASIFLHGPIGVYYTWYVTKPMILRVPGIILLALLQ